MKLILIILLLSPIISLSQWAIMESDADSLVLKGADYIYNVEFDSARASFAKVQKMYPNHPAGYFLDAMVDWWRITIHRNERAFEDEFIEKIDNVIDLCDELLEENEFDLTALFFKGGALGYRGRYHANKENWIKAGLDGKEAFDIMRQCYFVAPGNHDIMLGTGIYNYFAGAIPEKYPFTEPLLYFLPDGDKNIGKLQLKASAENARYSQVEAKVALLQIFYSFENDYKSAQEWASSLFRKYPNNPYFHRYLARTYNKRGQWQDLEKEWREILIRCINRMEGYNNKTAREASYYVGRALERKREYELSLKYYKKTIEICEFIEDQESGFYLSAQLKVAIVLYKLERQKEAESAFESVLDSDDYEGSHKTAKYYLDKYF